MYYKLLKNLVTLRGLSEYTEITEITSKPSKTMDLPGNCLRFVSTTAVLIGLQLFSTGVASATVSSNPVLVDAKASSVILVAQFDDYIPPNNGGPAQSQGSGTR